MLFISVGTEILPAISLAYEEAELDIMTRPPRRRDMHLVSAQVIIYSYFFYSWIEAAGAMLGYFSTFYYFGFEYVTLRKLMN
jgi:sodium/potassium-transporting ATPase subunit alpha